MPLNTILKTASLGLLAVAMSLIALPSDADAQNIFRPAHRVGRFLGLGYGPGYNWNQPGPNSDYYNPYSSHNSRLLHRDPRFIQKFGNQRDAGDAFQSQSMDYYLNDSRTSGGSVPYSVYSPTGDNLGGYEDMPGANMSGSQIDSSFEEDNSYDEDSSADERSNSDEDDSSYIMGENNDFQPATTPFNLRQMNVADENTTETPLENMDEHKFDEYRAINDPFDAEYVPENSILNGGDK